MDKLFSNDTETEKVISFAALDSGNRSGSKYIKRASAVLSLAIVIVLFVPMDLAVKAIVLLVLAAVLVTAVILAEKKARDRVGTEADIGYVKTGENDRYHYDFYEDKVTVSGAAECVIPFAELLSVHDIGSAFQFRTSERSFTVKKSGFARDDIKRFRDLMIANGKKVI